MSLELPYPPVLGEFLDILDGLRITHEERNLLEEMMRLGQPTNTRGDDVVSEKDHQISSRREPASFLGSINRRRRRNHQRARHQTNHTRSNGLEVHRDSAVITRDRRQSCASHRSNETGRSEPFTTLSDDSHHAFVIPWQSSDLPMSALELSVELAASPDHNEDASLSVTSGSRFDSPCLKPTESHVEQIEWCQDFIKVAWSDDTMD